MPYCRLPWSIKAKSYHTEFRHNRQHFYIAAILRYTNKVGNPDFIFQICLTLIQKVSLVSISWFFSMHFIVFKIHLELSGIGNNLVFNGNSKFPAFNTRFLVYYFWNRKMQTNPSPSFAASRDRNHKQQDVTDAVSLHLRGEAKAISLEVSLQQLLACQVSKKWCMKSPCNCDALKNLMYCQHLVNL